MTVILNAAEPLRFLATVAPTGPDTWWSLAGQAVVALAPMLLAALSWLSLQAAGLIKAKVKHQRLQSVLLRLDDAVHVAARQIFAAIAEEVKLAIADGKLTPEERSQLRTAILTAVRSYLGPKALVEICHILGIAGEDDERVLGPRADAAAFELGSRKVANGVH